MLQYLKRQKITRDILQLKAGKNKNKIHTYYKCLQGGSGASQRPRLCENAEAGIVNLWGGILPLS